jgi:type IV pilus assembly protein PilO
MGAFKTIPMGQKLALVSMVLIGIAALFYYYIESPQQEVLTALNTEIVQLDKEIQINKAKTRSLEDLKRVNAELEQQLAKNQEQLPPEDEAATLLKQISDLGIRIGLNFKLWKPGARAEDSSKLFVRMPVDVEMSGGYHTLALFFDRISKLPRIINVSKIKMGGGKTERGRVSIQTTFELTAFASLRAAAAAPVKAPDAK